LLEIGTQEKSEFQIHNLFENNNLVLYLTFDDERLCLRLNQKSVIIIFVLISLSISLILPLFSLQMANEALGKQFLAFAAGSLLTGIIAFACLIMHSLIRKAHKNAEGYEINTNED